jgi:hypothetical protein
VGGEDLVGGRGAVGEGGGEVEEVFEEDFYGGEAGGGCCGEFGGDLVDPSTLDVLVVVEDRGKQTYAQGHAADCWSV